MRRPAIVSIKQIVRALNRRALTLVEVYMGAIMGLIMMGGIYIVHRTAWETWQANETLLALGQQTTSAIEAMVYELRKSHAPDIIGPSDGPLDDSDGVNSNGDLNGDTLDDWDSITFRIVTDADSFTGSNVNTSNPITYQLNQVTRQLERLDTGTGQIRVLANNITAFWVEPDPIPAPNPQLEASEPDPAQVTLFLAAEMTTSAGRQLRYPSEGGTQAVTVVPYNGQVGATEGEPPECDNDGSCDVGDGENYVTCDTDCFCGTEAAPEECCGNDEQNVEVGETEDLCCEDFFNQDDPFSNCGDGICCRPFENTSNCSKLVDYGGFFGDCGSSGGGGGGQGGF